MTETNLDKMLHAKGFRDFVSYVWWELDTLEISEFVHRGKGPGKMQAAANAWKNLADKLKNLADAQEKVLSVLLAGPWAGASAHTMAAAAKMYIEWVHATARTAKNTYNRVSQVVSAYKKLHEDTVPPQWIVDNRRQWLQLQELQSDSCPMNRSNFWPHLLKMTELERKFDQMRWQNIEAIFRYKSHVDPVSHLEKFHQAPQITPWIARPGL